MMSRPEKVVLSDENVELLAIVARMVGGEEEVAKDPNFALSLLFKQIKERPSSTVMRALLDSLDPSSIEYARKELARNKAA